MAEVIGLVPPPLPTLPGIFGIGNEGGLETLTVALPAKLTLPARTWTVICVEVEDDGAINWPCDPPRVQITVETCVGSVDPFMKFVPVTASERPLPTVAQVGETAETVGTGLGGLPMMKLMVFERPLLPVPEAGLMVLMVARPGFAINEVPIVATTERTFPFVSVVTVVLHAAPLGSVPALVLTGQVFVFH